MDTLQKLREELAEEKLIQEQINKNSSKQFKLISDRLDASEKKNQELERKIETLLDKIRHESNN